MTLDEATDGQWTTSDGYQANERRRAVEPCGERHRGDCRCDDDGSGAPESVATQIARERRLAALGFDIPSDKQRRDNLAVTLLAIEARR